MVGQCVNRLCSAKTTKTKVPAKHWQDRVWVLMLRTGSELKTKGRLVVRHNSKEIRNKGKNTYSGKERKKNSAMTQLSLFFQALEVFHCNSNIALYNVFQYHLSHVWILGITINIDQTITYVRNLEETYYWKASSPPVCAFPPYLLRPVISVMNLTYTGTMCLLPLSKEWCEWRQIMRKKTHDPNYRQIGSYTPT